MVDRTKTVTAAKDPVITAATVKRYVIMESTVSTSDTVTVDKLTTLLGATAIRKDTGAVLTATVATNVVTITSVGLTNVDVVILAYGTP